MYLLFLNNTYISMYSLSAPVMIATALSTYRTFSSLFTPCPYQNEQ